LAAATALPDPGLQTAPAVEPAVVTTAEVTAARAAIGARWQTILPPTYAVRAAKPVALPSAPHAAGADADGVRWGSVIHLLLQATMRQPGADVTALAALALRAADLDLALAGEAVETVRRVMQSAVWHRAESARRRLTEVPFVVRLSREGDAVVRGVIDLAFEEADGWVLVDYKTDQPGAAGVGGLLETYRPQLETYRECWRQSTQQPVKEVGVYATRADRYVVLPS
jgi:ATP-dependent helicase/nuclease subunit A